MAMPVVVAAARTLDEMATFGEAGRGRGDRCRISLTADGLIVGGPLQPLGGGAPLPDDVPGPGFAADERGERRPGDGSFPRSSGCLSGRVGPARGCSRDGCSGSRCGPWRWFVAWIIITWGAAPGRPRRQRRRAVFLALAGEEAGDYERQPHRHDGLSSPDLRGLTKSRGALQPRPVLVGSGRCLRRCGAAGPTSTAFSSFRRPARGGMGPQLQRAGPEVGTSSSPPSARFWSEVSFSRPGARSSGLVVLAVAHLMARWMVGVLGGLTGDTYGALSEVGGDLRTVDARRPRPPRGIVNTPMNSRKNSVYLVWVLGSLGAVVGAGIVALGIGPAWLSPAEVIRTLLGGG